MNLQRTPRPGCSRSTSCQYSHCYNGGSCIDSWTTTGCNCANGYDGPQCEEKLTASFTQDTMSMKMEHSEDIQQVSFQILVANVFDGIIMSTGNKVRNREACQLVLALYHDL